MSSERGIDVGYEVFARPIETQRCESGKASACGWRRTYVFHSETVRDSGDSKSRASCPILINAEVNVGGRRPGRNVSRMRDVVGGQQKEVSI